MLLNGKQYLCVEQLFKEQNCNDIYLSTLFLYTTMPNRTYINESHRKYSEACQKEVDEMSKHPLSLEQKLEQMRRNHEESVKAAIQKSEEKE